MSKQLEISGWIIFVASALFFTAASWRAGDMLALMGSLLFLLACFIFLAKYFLKDAES